MNECKRAALIGTVCGAGKCALCAALPILSAAGIETCVVPTGVRPVPNAEEDTVDLSRNLPAFAERWKREGFVPDAVASGLPGNLEQAGALTAFLRAFGEAGPFLMIGPSEWNGAGGSPESFTEADRYAESFFARADLIVLHIGAAAALMGERTHQGPWDRRTVETLLKGLCAAGAKKAVLTGIWFSPDLLGAAGYSADTGYVTYAFSHRIAGEWKGAGDLFSASLLAGLLNGKKLSIAMQLAVDFTAECIRYTRESGEDGRRGLKFEACLPKLIREFSVLWG